MNMLANSPLSSRRLRSPFPAKGVLNPPLFTAKWTVHPDAVAAAATMQEPDQSSGFMVELLPDVSKDGQKVRFMVKVLHPDRSETILSREYEDFEFLHHNLETTTWQADGIIMPPLPVRINLDPDIKRHLEQQASNGGGRSVAPDDYSQDVYAVEKYLRQLLAHPTLATDRSLMQFLTEPNPPVRCDIKKGFFDDVKKSLDARKALAIQDPDEGLQREKQWAQQYILVLKDFRCRFQAMGLSSLRLANQMSHLANCLISTVVAKDDLGKQHQNMLSTFASCLEEERKLVFQYSPLLGPNRSLANCLSFWSGYVDAENEMFNRRCTLIMEVDKASKAVAKAKSGKIQIAEYLHRCKDEQLQKCAKVAEAEVSRIHKQRIQETHQALIQWVQAQIEAAKQTKVIMEHCLQQVQAFTLPKLKPELEVQH